jgi:hypothetical protein
MQIPKGRWENYITMDPKQIGQNGVECIDMAQDTEGWRAVGIWGIASLALELLASLKQSSTLGSDTALSSKKLLTFQ